MLPEVSKEEVEWQVQEVAKFFKQLGGAPAIVAFTKCDWMDYMEKCFEETGKGCETSAQDFGSDFGRSRSRVEGRHTTEVGSRRK